MKKKISVSIPPALLKKLEELVNSKANDKLLDRSELICQAIEEFIWTHLNNARELKKRS